MECFVEDNASLISPVSSSGQRHVGTYDGGMSTGSGSGGRASVTAGCGNSAANRIGRASTTKRDSADLAIDGAKPANNERGVRWNAIRGAKITAQHPDHVSR